MNKLPFALVMALSSVAYTSAAAPVPFKATIETVFTPPSPCGGPVLCLEITGRGQGSHFGLMTIEGPSQVNLATLVQTGTSIWTAADGSTLFINLVGTIIPDATGGAVFQGTWVAASGTGRFAGETGIGTYHGSAVGAGTGVLHLEGILSNPGSK